MEIAGVQENDSNQKPAVKGQSKNMTVGVYHFFRDDSRFIYLNVADGDITNRATSGYQASL